MLEKTTTTTTNCPILGNSWRGRFVLLAVSKAAGPASAPVCNSCSKTVELAALEVVPDRLSQMITIPSASLFRVGNDALIIFFDKEAWWVMMEPSLGTKPKNALDILFASTTRGTEIATFELSALGVMASEIHEGDKVATTTMRRIGNNALVGILFYLTPQTKHVVSETDAECMYKKGLGWTK